MSCGFKIEKSKKIITKLVWGRVYPIMMQFKKKKKITATRTGYSVNQYTNDLTFSI